MSKDNDKIYNEYEVYGPFGIALKGGIPDRSRVQGKKSALHEDIETARAGLASAYGCYVFATKGARGYRPWYVGKTEKKGLHPESVNSDNLYSLSCVSAQLTRGRLVLFLIPRMTPGGRFAKGNPADISHLEGYLIGEALKQNAKLLNTQHAAMARSTRVPGLLNSGKGNLLPPAKELKHVFSGKKREAE